MSGVTARRGSSRRLESSSRQKALVARQSRRSGERSRKPPRGARPNRTAREYDLSVFINCPFDRAYLRLFHSIVFAVFHCGFRARCALELDDGSQVRITKILKIIRSCRYGIHDLSRTEIDTQSRLPRFNMPLELGFFIGAKEFGGVTQSRKSCLILDREQFRYQKFISDIAGQDIRAHDRKERRAITATRDWLSSCTRRNMPGGTHIHAQFEVFMRKLPQLCKDTNLKPSELTFNDYTFFVTSWLESQIAVR